MQGLVDLESFDFPLTPRCLARIAAHTDLTQLCLKVTHNDRCLELPPSISSLSRLAALQMSGSEGELEHISCLTQLSSLDLRGCIPDDLEQLLPPLCQLTSLTLQLSWDDFCPLPPAVSVLTRLAALQLRNCHLMDQWPPILAAAAAAGQRLTRLQLVDSALGDIPEELISLTALQHFDVSPCNEEPYVEIGDGLQHLAGLPLTHLKLHLRSRAACSFQQPGGFASDGP